MLSNRIPARYHVFIPTVLLLIVAASRILRLAEWELDNDEVWTIWQTFGSPLDIVRWTPYDWPPFHYLLVGGWKELVGIHPTVMVYLSVLIFLVGTASMYRLTCHIKDQRAAIIAVLVYASLGYSIVLSMQLRGYVIQLSLLPLMTWLAIRYFEYSSVKRAVPLAILMAVMMYTHYTSIISIGLVGLYTLINYPKVVWRWWLPGVISAVLFIPEFLSKLTMISNRSDVTSQMDIGALPDRLRDLFETYTGGNIEIWLGLFVVSALLIAVFHQRQERRRVIAIMVWVLGFPILMYYLNPLTGFFYYNRHALWFSVGLGLLAGWGVSYLPDLLLLPVALILSLATFTEIPTNRYGTERFLPPMRTNLVWLQDFYRPGDVIVIDPSVNTIGLEMWDYYSRVYFSDGGLYIVDEPGDYRRVWYASVSWLRDPALYATILQDRVPGRFVGPPELLLRLFEGPPDQEGVLFENGMRFLGADVMGDNGPDFGPLVRREGQSVRLRLWWVADTAIEMDYSVSTLLLEAPDGPVLFAYDGPPNVADGPPETSRWESERYYIEERVIEIPYPIESGKYPLCLTVYQWWDGMRVPASGATDSQGLYCFDVLHVKAW